MGITGSIVVFTVCWFLALFCVLPLRIRTQSDLDRVEPGTPPSAPMETGLRWKALAATVAAAVLWFAAFLAMEFHLVTLSDLESALPTMGVGNATEGLE